MATLNPLEQKARASFIKGFIFALLIGILVSGFLGMQIFKMRGEEKQRLASQKTVLVLTKSVLAGETLDSSMFKTLSVDAGMATSGAVKSFSELESAYLNPTDTETVTTTNETTEEVETATLVAKIDLGANTVMNIDMVSSSEEKTTDDLREQEYNMIVLPSNLDNNDTIDIRLRLPNGVDYIVLSKKKAITNSTESTTTSGSNTIFLKETEEERLIMSAAIVDAYKIKGSKFYATKYTDPGLQKSATKTYIPSQDVLTLIQTDANIVEQAKSALASQYGSNLAAYRNQITNFINKVDADEQQSLVESETATEISTQQSERQQYLQGLSEESTIE